MMRFYWGKIISGGPPRIVI